MNLFDFLKSTSGKLVLKAPQLLAIGGAGALFVYGAYKTDEATASKEPPIRSLSGITASSAYEGLQNKDGLLTSINIKDSLNQVATAEERAALEGNSGLADNFGLDHIDNIQNISFGSAAETSATEGLGMGANKAVETGPGVRGAVGTAAPGAAMGDRAGQAVAAAAERPTLGTASMARASGNAFNAASGAIGGSTAGSASGSSRSGARGSSGGGGSSEGYEFSGAMPSGSNAISSLGLSRSSNSSFMAGGRNAVSSRGSRAFREKDELKDISKRSADAAKNQNRAANEGSRAFLASTRNSGGMTVEGGKELETTGSADFESATKQPLKAIGDWKEAQDDYAKKQDKARKLLMWMILGLVVLTLAAAALGYYLISAGKLASPVTTWMVVLGWTVLGIGMAAAAGVIVHAAMYQKKYNGVFLPVAGYLMGAASLTALIAAGVAASKGGGSEAVKALFSKKSVSALKTVGMMGATTAGTSLAKEAISKDAERASQASSDEKQS